MARKDFNNILGGLNLTQSSAIPDNCFVELTNMFYNSAKQLQTRRWFRKFWPEIGGNPITSYFFYQRDDTLAKVAICLAWDKAYSYDWSARNQVASNLRQYETLPWRVTERTRWDFAVYKNVCYMWDWVNTYRSFDWSTLNEIWVSGSAVTVTFDHTTDTMTAVAHWLNNGDEILFNVNWVIPWEITAYQVYYIINKTTHTFQISTTKNGTAVTYTDNWTWTNQYQELTEPRLRYIQYLGDRLYWAGDDGNPSTLYYSWAAPADGTAINANAVIVWGDEWWVINGLNEYTQLVIAFKDNKSYAVNVAAPSAQAIDSQTGWYCDRSIQFVGDSLVYLTDMGVDTLIKRSGVDGVGAIASKPLSLFVKPLIDLIEQKQLNANVGAYIKPLNNYYFAFDTNADNKPDTILVYSSLTKGRSKYTLPSLYDFGTYIDTDGNKQYLFASASWGQMYEFEYGYDDDGVAIDVVAETKPHDFNQPWQVKEFGYIELTGYKQEWWTIDISVLLDWEIRAGSVINDSYLNIDNPSFSLWVSVLGEESIWWNPTDEWLPMYKYTIRVPFRERAETIAIRMESSGVQWLLEKYVVDINGVPEQVFYYDNIG